MVGVVIVGSGQGGCQVAASLREGGFAGPVTLVGDEGDLPYNRPPLSKAYLKGEVDAQRIRLRPPAWYAAQRIELLAGRRVAAVDRGARAVRLDDGRDLLYDHLVLATGARDRRLAVPGAELDGVLTLRNLKDADALRARLAGARDVVVIGAGFIGLEFAAVATALGKRVHVVELAQRAMGRAVSAAISAHFTEAHARAGATILFSASVARIEGEGGRVRAVATADGITLPADLVLVGIGVVPNVELAAAAGLAAANGIVVDRRLATADPLVSAIGDCALFPGPSVDGAAIRLESVQNTVDQARCVAARLNGKPRDYAPVPWFWSDQGGLRLQIAGLTAGHDATVVRGTPADDRFAVFCFKGTRLLGVETVNQAGEHMLARRLLAGGSDLSPDQAADPGFDLKAHAAGLPAAAGAKRA